jgi:hypothetical protein
MFQVAIVIVAQVLHAHSSFRQGKKNSSDTNKGQLLASDKVYIIF